MIEANAAILRENVSLIAANADEYADSSTGPVGQPDALESVATDGSRTLSPGSVNYEHEP